MMIPPIRYHPWLVALHWVLAVLIVAMLGVGFARLGQMRAGDPGLLAVLTWHAAGGIVILALMILRFAVRMRTLRPPKASTGHHLLDGLALVSHHAFYVIVLAMAGTGLTTALDAGLLAAILGRSPAVMPVDFTMHAPFVAHALLATLLANLIVLHLVAVGYHQLVRRDGLLSRMLFARRG